MPKMPESAPPETIVVAWYTPENFDRIRKLAPDGGGLQETFEEWHAQAQAMIVEIARTTGIKIVRFDMDPDQLARWLKARKVKCNEKTRALFAHEMYVASIATKH